MNSSAYPDWPPPPGPVQPPRQPPTDRWFSNERGLGLTTSIAMGAASLLYVGLAATSWNSYRVVKAYADGPIRDPDSIERADLISWFVALFLLVAYVSAIITFIVWLWRVRWNSELFCRAEHRRARGWVIGGWFCPVVWFWFPKQIVDDVVAASDPRTPPQADHLRGIPGTGLVWAWWLTWTSWFALGWVESVLEVANAAGIEDPRDADGRLLQAVTTTVLALLAGVAAVLAVRLIDRVNDVQAKRPWVTWWAPEAPTARPNQPGMPQYGPPGMRGRLGQSPPR